MEASDNVVGGDGDEAVGDVSPLRSLWLPRADAMKGSVGGDMGRRRGRRSPGGGDKVRMRDGGDNGDRRDGDVALRTLVMAVERDVALVVVVVMTRLAFLGQRLRWAFMLWPKVK